jgi:hypothetical protein
MEEKSDIVQDVLFESNFFDEMEAQKIEKEEKANTFLRVFSNKKS